MGQVRAHVGTEVLTQSLATSTVIGRHWSCDVRIPHPSVPLRWLEIRWSLEGWLWRALSGGDRTRGTGSVHQAGWRLLSTPGSRVRLDGAPIDIIVELASVDPPTLFAQHLVTGVRLEGPSFEEWFTVGHDGRVSVIGDDQSVLQDGAVTLLNGQPYRVFLPAVMQPTSPVRLDLTDPKLWVGISQDQEEAVFSNGLVQVSVTGACVKVLATYARALIEGKPWLRTADAHALWIEKGGASQSSADRLAWERSKLRKKLSAQGVIQVDTLFESRRKMDYTETRIVLTAEQVSVD